MTTELAPIDPQGLLLAAVERGAGIETLERLVALAREVREQQARAAWYHAMAAFQRDCPAVLKGKTARIPTRSGPGYSYRYADLGEVLDVIQPTLGQHGLSVTWRSTTQDAAHVAVVAMVAHQLGHVVESGEVAMPIPGGNPTVGANVLQRVGIALAYAKRYSMLAALGIAPVDDDTDGATPAPAGQGDVEGPGEDLGARPVTAEQVRKLAAVATGQRWDVDAQRALLALYGCEAAGQLGQRHYEEVLHRLKLGPKEGLKGATPPPPPAAA